MLVPALLGTQVISKSLTVRDKSIGPGSIVIILTILTMNDCILMHGDALSYYCNYSYGTVVAVYLIHKTAN